MSPGKAWRSYSWDEKCNLGIYIAGIMCYKVGIEFYLGSMTSLTTNPNRAGDKPFTNLGAARGIDQAAQCVGAILIAPLVRRWPTRTVLSAAIFLFAFTSAILLIVDAATGGHWKVLKPGISEQEFGKWTPNIILFIWMLSGLCFGMVELIRRVIPADIVGGDLNKLRQVDAIVHIFYEIAGTAGAGASTTAIGRWGDIYSCIISPVFFTIAGGIWVFISVLNFEDQAVEEDLEPSINGSTPNYLVQIYQGFKGFGESIWIGAKLVSTNRALIWLLPSYSVALYLHRFLENNLAPAFAEKVLNTRAWRQIIVGGSNFGELLGALAVLVLGNTVPTPLPWLRLDALALNIVWVLPAFSGVATKNVSWAWKVAACFIPMSMGWAAGDVSLAAYIQSALTSADFEHPNVSILGAVMAFLYATYIILNAVFSTVYGNVIDRDGKSSFKTVGGAQFTVFSVVILASTFIPRGAFSFNPKALEPISAESTRVIDPPQHAIIELEESRDVYEHKRQSSQAAFRPIS